LWRHHLGPVEPPLRLRQISYGETGAMQYPHHEDRAPETDLERYLEEASALLSAVPVKADHMVAPQAHALSEDFEHLRWFDRPAACSSPG